MTLSHKYIIFTVMSILDFFRRLFKRPEPTTITEPKVSEPVKQKEERFILCIDGGGMRGIIPAVLLQEFEKLVRSAGGDKDIATYFDLIAGTSTGGLISLALSCESKMESIEVSNGKQLSLDGLLENYMSMGEIIFQAKPSFFGIRQIADNKYHSSGIQNYVQSMFGTSTMQSAKVPTMVVAYDLSVGKDELFTSFDQNKEEPIWVAARSTSAAPTYFEPLVYGDKVLVDGGVIANNPAIYAYTEARKLYPECEVFHILSLSTGGAYHTMTKDDISGGLMGWVNQIAPMYGTAQKRTSDHVLENLPGVVYTRIDDPLPEAIKMDETNRYALNLMETRAHESAQRHMSELSDFATKLVEHDKGQSNAS